MPTVAEYTYLDKDGNVCGKVERVEPGRDGRLKEFFPYRFDGSQFVRGLNGKPLPLYHADEVAQAIADGLTIFVVEGEGKADALRAALQATNSRAVVTTLAGGCKAPLLDEHLTAFDGAVKLVFLTDSDEPGRASARARADVLACRYPQADVRVVDLFPDRDDKLDVADWLREGHALTELRALILAAARIVPTPPRAVHVIGGDGGWGDLQPIDSVPNPEPLPLTLVPEAYRAYVADVCDMMCVPVEFLAFPLMIATAAVLGRKVMVRPEQRNPWVEVPNLWGANVAEPGMMKSPAQDAAFAPLERLQSIRRHDFDTKSATLKERQHVAKLRLESIEQTYKAAIKADKPTAEMEADMQAQQTILAEHVLDRRYYVSDTTIEKFAMLLCDNHQGLLQKRDELTGWLHSLDKKGREQDRPFYLEGWNGKNPYPVDRVGRGSITVPFTCILNFGGIQPGPLRKLVAEAIRGDAGADGLLQRFNLTAVCLAQPAFRKCDREADHAARAQVDAVFDALDTIEFDGNGNPHVVSLDDQAQAVFDEWRADLERRVRSDEETPAFRVWLTKQRKTVPALSLLFHLIDTNGAVGRPISRDAVRLACAWDEILETHARYIYGSAVATPAMFLAAKIQKGHLKDGLTVRELKRSHWAGLATDQAVDNALKVLADSGWLRVSDASDGIRPSPTITLHPSLREASHG